MHLFTFKKKEHGRKASAADGSKVEAPCRPDPQPPTIVVNQNYYLVPSTLTARSKSVTANIRSVSSLKLNTVVHRATDLVPTSVPQLFNDGLPGWHGPGSQLLNQTAALCDQLLSSLDNLLTSIDCGYYGGNKWDILCSPAATSSRTDETAPTTTSSPTLGKYLAKVDTYANSRLPLNLPPMRLYMETYPLLCLAAKYADSVYEQPRRDAERFFHIDADWRTGSKAMVIKSIPMDQANTIVFAIRGTATFMDWAVNLNTAPTSPDGFLDDPGNFCHAGFLSVARKMIHPVAVRIRELLQEDPGRAAYSLLITGHSAGGAVAALLYSHMLATTQQASSELNMLTNCFRRIHCITFGTPPVSLLPLTKPDRGELRKCLFLSFVNEGDPVVRADKAYVKSLLDLLTNSSPETGSRKPKKAVSSSSLRPRKSHKFKSLRGQRNKHEQDLVDSPSQHGERPVWKLPPSTLSNPGRLIVLRSYCPLPARHRGPREVEDILNEGVVAQFTTDEQLREIVWGDPLYHVMKLYAGRIETLAVGAVTANN